MPQDLQWHSDAKACHFLLGPSDVVSGLASVLSLSPLTLLAELGIHVSFSQCTLKL